MDLSEEATKLMSYFWTFGPQDSHVSPKVRPNAVGVLAFHEPSTSAQRLSWTPQRGSVGWISRSLSTSKDEVEDKAGLDHAMYLEFLELSMRTVLSQPLCDYFLGHV